MKCYMAHTTASKHPHCICISSFAFQIHPMNLFSISIPHHEPLFVLVVCVYQLDVYMDLTFSPMNGARMLVTYHRTKSIYVRVFGMELIFWHFNE